VNNNDKVEGDPLICRVKTLVAIAAILGSFSLPATFLRAIAYDQTPQASPANSSLLRRLYQEGEKLSYHMNATNKDHDGTQSYEAQVEGVVKKDSAGNFYEEYQWSDLVWDGKATPVAPDFRQVLSLDPGFKPSFPDLQHAGSRLVGPVLDLMTFYVDLGLAIRKGGLNHPGDRVYVPFGRPTSWAAGEGLIIGEDSIDFDITLQKVDRDANTATVLVRHVPPAETKINLPAPWMHVPVADTPNNWVEVRKNKDGKYVASVGKETFDDVIKTSLIDGRILSATMDNPVDVFERECNDAALTICGAPIRYEIRRQIAIQ
jgi:hypothetical protein